MLNLINTLYYDAVRSLNQMRRSDMKLSERLKYEKALLQLEIMKQLIDKNNLTPKP